MIHRIFITNSIHAILLQKLTYYEMNHYNSKLIEESTNIDTKYWKNIRKLYGTLKNTKKP